MNIEKIKNVLLVTIVTISFLIIGFFFFTQKKDNSVEIIFNPKEVLATLNTTNSVNDFLEIQAMIGEVMKEYGTKAGFELIEEGQRQGIINNDSCHGLLHYVGHAAYEESPYDYTKLLSVVEGTNCLGGYLHGIEAEMVLSSSNVIQDVQNFCTFQKAKGVNPGPCYHGAGHAAAELYKYDVPQSLALCDAIAGGPENDMSNCYRGIFSEIGNIVTGYDGHTGLGIDTVPIVGLDVKKPYEYCESFEKKYQSSCMSQLTKVATKDLNMQDWLSVCLNPDITIEASRICTNITADVYIRSMLSSAQTAVLPNIINQFSDDLQQIAILGSAEAFAGYRNNEVPKDWRPFCNAFEKESVQEYCVSIFTDIDENNTAPWMERTDIR